MLLSTKQLFQKVKGIKTLEVRQRRKGSPPRDHLSTELARWRSSKRLAARNALALSRLASHPSSVGTVINPTCKHTDIENKLATPNRCFKEGKDCFVDALISSLKRKCASSTSIVANKPISLGHVCAVPYSNTTLP